MSRLKRQRPYEATCWLLLALSLAGACSNEISSAPLAVAVTSLDKVVSASPAMVLLDGRQSYVIGAPGTLPDAVNWRVVVAPDGLDRSLAPDIDRPDSLEATLLIRAPGLYVVRLEVQHEGRAGIPAFLNIHSKRELSGPVASVSPVRQEVDPLQEVAISAADSYTPAGGGLSYSWEQTQGAPASILESGRELVLTAPRAAGTLLFRLVVTDARGEASLPAFAQVIVRELPPMAVIQAPSSVDEGSFVVLGGAGSFDPNGRDITSWTWSLEWAERPEDTPTLEDGDMPTASFRAPPVAGQVQPILASLTVVNDIGASATTTKEIHVIDVVNNPPVASAGPPRTVGELQQISLDGSGSYDPNGDPLTFSWAQDTNDGSPAVSLAGANTATPSFVTPRLSEPLQLTFVLRVTDSKGLSDSDRVVITVERSIVALSFFEQPPGTVIAGQGFAVAVEILDANGQREERVSDTITLSLSAGPLGEMLLGVTSRDAVAGKAVFDGLSISGAGEGYRVLAESAVLSEATSAPLSVLPGFPHGNFLVGANPGSITADGESVATITSEEISDSFGNRVLDGSLFTASTTRGQIQAVDLLPQLPGTQVETVEGRAQFEIISSTTAGEAVVTLTSMEGSAEGSTSVSFLPGPPQGPIALSAADERLPADGSSTTLVSGGPIKDAHGNLVEDGTLLTISVYGGTVGEEDADASLEGVQVPVQGGELSVEIGAGTTSGELRVLVSSIQGASLGEVTIMLDPLAPAGTIDLSATPSTLTADGASTSTITSDPIRDANGNIVAEGTVVAVSITGDAALLVDQAEQPITTDSGGVITFGVRSGTVVGQVTVSASAAGASGQTTIELVPGAPSNLEYHSGNLQEGPVMTALPETLVVRIIDAQDNAVGGATVLWAAVAGGGSVTEASTVSNEQGLAEVRASLGTLAGDYVYGYTASASYAGVPLDDSPFTFTASASPGLPHGSVAMSSTASELVADGSSTAEITAGPVTDPHGNVVADGSLFTISAQGGSIPADDADPDLDGTQIGVEAGFLSFLVVAGETAGDFSVGVVSVDGTAEGTLTLTLLPGPPEGVIELFADPDSLVADGASTSTITSDPIRDANGNIVAPGTTVAVTIEGDASLTTADSTPGVEPHTVDTDATGRVTFEVRAGTTTSDPVTVRAASGDALGEVVISVRAGPVAELRFLTHPGDGTAGETIAPAVEVAILDAHQNLVLEETDVSIALDGGEGDVALFGTMSMTSADGVAVFGDLSIEAPGEGYRLVATAPGLLAKSLPFDMAAPLVDLHVDAGPEDRGRLPWDTVHLAGDVSGGSPPYSLIWDVIQSPYAESFAFAAHLEGWPGDSSVAGVLNPLFWPRGAGEYTIRLAARDSMGVVAESTTVIEVEGFREVATAPAGDHKTMRSLTVIPKDGSIGAVTSNRAFVFSPTGVSSFGRHYIDCTEGREGSSVAIAGLDAGSTFLMAFSDSAHLTRVDALEPDVTCSNIHVGLPLPAGDPKVHGLTRDPSSGDVWVATESDLTLLPAGSDVVAGHYYFDDAGSNQPYYAAELSHEEAGGRLLFVSGDGESYYRTSQSPFDGGALASPLPGSSDRIVYILRGAKVADGGLDEIWFATSGSGLFRAIDARESPLTVERFTTADGLPSDSVTQLAFDDSGGGDVWAATLLGVARYKRDVNAVVGLVAGQDGLCTGQVLSLTIDDFALDTRGRRVFVGCDNGLFGLFSPPAVVE